MHGGRLIIPLAGIITDMKNTDREVMYLVGDSAEKRRLMRSGGQGVARALNDEVSAVCRVTGRDYYVVGKHPFAAFTVWQYMRYERALLSATPLNKKEAAALLKKMGVRVSLRRRFGSLSYAERRLVTAASRITGRTSTVALNLDGAPYSRRLKKQLRRAVKRLRSSYALWIAVTDSRLVPRRAGVVEVKPNTLYSHEGRTYRSFVVTRSSLLARLRRCFAEPVPVEAGKVVCVTSR